MSSDLKTQTARANGAKSRGPVTPEGLERSSRNSLSHGLSAQRIVLPDESTEEFQILLDAHIHQFHPANPMEMELVHVMVVARWRLRRILALETSLLANELVRRAEDIDDEFIEMTGDDRLAWVFQRLADNGQSLALLARYEGTLNRTFDRAFKQLNILQATRPQPGPESPQQNEPKVHLPGGPQNGCDHPSPLDSHDCGRRSPLPDHRGDLSSPLQHLP
jgi:hypothetical protein